MYLSFGGRVGRDPDLKTIQSGSTVCNFPVAVSGYNRQTREKTTEWVRVAIWGKRGEQMAELLRKGSTVSITGKQTLRLYEGKIQIEVETNDVTLLGSPPREEEEDDDPPPARAQRDAKRNTSTSRKPPPDDDDIPF